MYKGYMWSTSSAGGLKPAIKLGIHWLWEVQIVYTFYTLGILGLYMILGISILHTLGIHWEYVIYTEHFRSTHNQHQIHIKYMYMGYLGYT